MSSGALRAAWEAAQKNDKKDSSALRAAWESAHATPAKPDIHEEYRSGRLAKRMQRENTNEREAVDAETPGYATQALGGIASLARDIPGAEVLQAGARSLLRDQSYTDSLHDIRGAEDDAPAAVRWTNRIAGAAPAYAMVPGSNMTKGAILGALQGFTDADPDADRATETLTRGAVGGMLGLAGDAAGAAGSKTLRLLKRQGAKEQAAVKAIIDRVLGRPASAPSAAPPASSGVSGLDAMEILPPPTPRPPAPPAPRPAAPSPTPAAATPTLDQQLVEMLARLRAQQPMEVGNLIGDAELAMARPTVAPAPGVTLEDLLRQSILSKGGVPRVP